MIRLNALLLTLLLVEIVLFRYGLQDINKLLIIYSLAEYCFTMLQSFHILVDFIFELRAIANRRLISSLHCLCL